MSTDVRSPSPTAWLSSRIRSSLARKHNVNPSLPTAIENQSSHHNHGRSSSFNEFVSRLLPSHRGEKGHTLRDEYNDDGIHNPVDIVFGLSPRRKSDENNSVGSEGSKMRKTSDWPLKNIVALDDTTGTVVGLKRSGALRRMFGSLRKGRKGDKEELATMQQEVTDTEQPVIESKLSDESKVLVIKAEERIIEMQPVINKSQQIYEDKKALREQRRSLRESDDFLGIQGANPRTGYWDVSDGTSTSEPSQLSEDTKKKLDEKARELDERKRRFEEAEAVHKKELERAQTLRDNKKKERAEKKKVEMKIKRRRHGKWNAGENGWSSVAEPDLSPIQQSVVGTPISVAVDRLFPMPTAADPTPYINTNSPIQAKDYFSHRMTFSPLARDWITDISVDTPTLSPNVTIRRKPVGSPTSPSHRRNDDSSKTVVHNSAEHVGVQPLTPPRHQAMNSTTVTAESAPYPPHANNPVTPPQRRAPFLEETINRSKSDSRDVSEAIATSYQLVSTKQVMIHQPLALCPETFTPKRQIISLKNLPPVHLKDPVAARIPLSSRTPSGLHLVRGPPAINKKYLSTQTSSTDMYTTTTTGHAHLQPLLTRSDGRHDMDVQTRRPLLHKASRIPLRMTSPQKEKEKNSQKVTFHGHPPGIDISSKHQLYQSPQKEKHHYSQNVTFHGHPTHRDASPERQLHQTTQKGKQNNRQVVKFQGHPVHSGTSSELHLNQTKKRTLRLCHTVSPEGDEVEMKSTPISTSMYHQDQQKQTWEARTAARQAFHNLKHQAAMKKAIPLKGGPLILPKLRNPNVREIKQNIKLIQGGREGTGDHLKSNMDKSGCDALVIWHPRDRFKRSAEKSRADGLVIWHPSPEKKAVVVWLPSAVEGIQEARAPRKMIGEIVDSAALFGMGILLFLLFLVGRVIGMGFQGLVVFMTLLKLFIGL